MNGSGNPLFGKSDVVTPMLTAACKASSETMPVPSKQTEAILRVQRDHHSADDDDDEQKNDEQTDAQPELFADHRENEIGVRVRQVEHFLPAVAEAEAFDSAAAPRDQRLHLLQARVFFELLRIHERGEPRHAFGHMMAATRMPASPPNESTPSTTDSCRR